MKKSKRPKAPPREPEIATGIDLVLAEISSGVGSGTRLNSRLQKAFGVPYAFLTETQWKEIKSKAGFRPSARFELNIALRRYWLTRLDTMPNAVVKAAVVETQKKLTEALQSMVALLRLEDLFKGPIDFDQRSPLQQRKELENSCTGLLVAISILSTTERRWSQKKGRPSYGPLYDLIHHLDFILHAQHGIRVTRSKNRIPAAPATDTPLEYVWTVIRVADLNVSKSTVDTVLRDYITDRDEFDRGFPIRAI